MSRAGQESPWQREEGAWEVAFVPVLLYPGLLGHRAHGDLRAASAPAPALPRHPRCAGKCSGNLPARPAAPGLLPAPGRAWLQNSIDTGLCRQGGEAEGSG